MKTTKIKVNLMIETSDMYGDQRRRFVRKLAPIIDAREPVSFNEVDKIFGLSRCTFFTTDVGVCSDRSGEIVSEVIEVDVSIR